LPCAARFKAKSFQLNVPAVRSTLPGHDVEAVHCGQAGHHAVAPVLGVGDGALVQDPDKAGRPGVLVPAAGQAAAGERAPYDRSDPMVRAQGEHPG
jgi:hypothetical protein